MQCPSCDATLETTDYEGVRIEICPGCDGEWLDAGELRHIVKVREVRFSPEQREAVSAVTKIKPVPLKGYERNLVCPRCGGQTEPHNYGGDTGIVIDRCEGCGGVWLDGGELERIQMLVESWDDGLPNLLAKDGPRLRQIAAEADERPRTEVSRFRFVNAIINGVLKVFD